MLGELRILRLGYEAIHPGTSFGNQGVVWPRPSASNWVSEASPSVLNVCE